MFNKHEFLGEFIGTFLMILLGTGAVAVDVLFGALASVIQVALVWAFTITIAIYSTRHLSSAHFNPAVTIAMIASKRMPLKKLPTYLLGQFSGAFCASLILFAIFNPHIAAYEAANNIVRGSVESHVSAKMFGEFYLQVGSPLQSMLIACLAEFVGTFLLIYLVFSLTEGCNVGKPNSAIEPLFIGLAVGVIVCVIGPLTQCCLNPIRDFAPRLVTMLFGWGTGALPDNMGGFFWVYILSPILGGLSAATFFTKVVEPAMVKNTASQEVAEEVAEVSTEAL
ncbi:aquaporin [Atopobacter sp. AH10]|uniref:MIP/aquaporin family protein n=1 Tax=Atopobacter sp. AH10 TaxID=2315861 RepID=UPI000EF208D9|nr:aquaporin [Atopobacter sp. AH10]RLK63819.1 aquaporin [Atopobacter sp. AH10]